MKNLPLVATLNSLVAQHRA
ncbi:unnamed protein product [Staurois parvus]|uniref:Uncharacterized protein n=1 Tax=Staurois parvus TaxID=386267 RepID=A0ABN9EIF1_9NEOB|nr:unnamed protein product [Staurois parvus]